MTTRQRVGLVIFISILFALSRGMETSFLVVAGWMLSVAMFIVPDGDEEPK